MSINHIYEEIRMSNYSELREMLNNTNDQDEDMLISLALLEHNFKSGIDDHTIYYYINQKLMSEKGLESPYKPLYKAWFLLVDRIPYTSFTYSVQILELLASEPHSQLREDLLTKSSIAIIEHQIQSKQKMRARESFKRLKSKVDSDESLDKFSKDILKLQSQLY